MFFFSKEKYTIIFPMCWRRNIGSGKRWGQQRKRTREGEIPNDTQVSGSSSLSELEVLHEPINVLYLVGLGFLLPENQILTNTNFLFFPFSLFKFNGKGYMYWLLSLRITITVSCIQIAVPSPLSYVQPMLMWNDTFLHWPCILNIQKDLHVYFVMRSQSLFFNELWPI